MLREWTPHGNRGASKHYGDARDDRGLENCAYFLRNQPLWQLGHCLASNRSGVTGNMLLHWMQTRWRMGLTTAPGWSGLMAAVGCDSAVFSELVSVDMGGF
jgi:hypothetical protein